MAQDQNPTIRLVHALNALDCVFSITEGFRQLAEQRAVHAESNRKIQGLGLSVWAAEQRDAGASIPEVMESTHDKLAELESIPAPSSENPASIESLQSVLTDGTKAVGWALDALKMGGGDVLDAALNPGASAQTIRLRTKLDEARSLFGTMENTLAMPNVLLDSSVEKMGDLASWFQQKSRELRAVIEREKNQSKPVLKKPVPKPDGWVKADLVSQAKNALGSFSSSTFDRIRKESGVSSSERGGKGQQRRFSRSELKKLIQAMKAGPFRNKAKIEQAWQELLEQ